MARSRNTQPKKYKIEENNYPRIIERRPRKGDIHPFTKKEIRELFNDIPPEYLYKLKTIELMPRTNNGISLIGKYYANEQKIVIYSQAMEFVGEIDWMIVFYFMEEVGMPVPDYSYSKDCKLEVKWNKEQLKTLARETIFFELGVHFAEINKTRRKPPHKIVSGKHARIHELRLKEIIRKKLS